ncbi:unnamed protein product [Periconia digitata]|uniref:Uncharacterized protein n=1 Tax=Periconia digitata TaxID=1303443 RepID=A0A9W4UTF5_9PLEO|nr:unnamed protein product [Periconia digitata]
MSALTAILPFVSRCSAITHGLYRLATQTKAASNILKTAKSINSLALVVKQLGTVIKEDDRIPSAEALETLEDVLDQCTTLLSEVERLFPHLADTEGYGTKHGDNTSRLPLDAAVVARLHYLLSHLASLRATLAVMLQTLNTAQSVMWARERPTVSPTECARAVANEKQQLEALVIEQQMTILLASKLNEMSRSDAKLLMDRDSSQSLAAVDHDLLQPASLFKYQDKFLATLDIHDSSEEQWLPAVCSVSRSQLERLLDRWTRLRRFEEILQHEEQKARAQKRETQQPSVESDSEDDDMSTGPTPVPQRPDTVQPLFAETQTLPIPIRNGNRPASPMTPSSSYGGSVSSAGNYLPIPVDSRYTETAPRSSASTLPVEAAAAVEAKDKDDDVDLGIPWTLNTRRHYWKYIDNKMHDSNTDAAPSEALSDRNCWVEILASWVCKEAIREAGYKFTRMQKEVRDGRRTRFETCFCIEHPLTFRQVEELVERTVDIYRKTQGPSPPPNPPSHANPRRSSFERGSRPTVSPQVSFDRNRTPKPNKYQQPQKPHTSYPPPPPLDRSISMPSPAPRYPENPRSSNLYLPLPNGAAPISIPPPQPPLQPQPVAGQIPQPHIYNTHLQQQQQQQNSIYSSPHTLYPPTLPHRPMTANLQPLDTHAPFQSEHPPHPSSAQHSPYRQAFPPQDPSRYTQNRRYEYYSSMSSDSDSAAGRSKSSRRRSKSRRRVEDNGMRSGRSRRKEGHSGATKAMMGVAGLTALLDGLVGI